MSLARLNIAHGDLKVSSYKSYWSPEQLVKFVILYTRRIKGLSEITFKQESWGHIGLVALCLMSGEEKLEHHQDQNQQKESNSSLEWPFLSQTSTTRPSHLQIKESSLIHQTYQRLCALVTLLGSMMDNLEQLLLRLLILLLLYSSRKRELLSLVLQSESQDIVFLLCQF